MTIEISPRPTVQQNSITLEGFNSRATERYIVNGLETVTSTFRAFTAAAIAGIPRMGQRHPNLTDLFVVNKTATMTGTGTAEVVVEYAIPDPEETAQDDAASFPVRVRISSAVQQVSTNQDVFGSLLTVRHDVSEIEAATGVTHTQRITQTGTVEVNKPATVVTAIRQELEHPAAKAAQYVGKVGALLGSGKREWLCTGITGESNDGENSYTVTYEFTNRPGSWDATIVAIDPATGEPFPDLIEEVGIRTVQLYEEIDFSGLGLPI